MEVDIEDLLGRKKRKSCNSSPRGKKKKLCLLSNKSDDSKTLNSQKLELYFRTSPCKMKTKENRKVNAKLSNQNYAASGQFDDFLHVFHRPKDKRKILNERKINYYFTKEQKSDCGLKPLDSSVGKNCELECSSLHNDCKSVNSSVENSCESVCSSIDNNCVSVNSSVENICESTCSSVDNNCELVNSAVENKSKSPNFSVKNSFKSVNFLVRNDCELVNSSAENESKTVDCLVESNSELVDTSIEGIRDSLSLNSSEDLNKAFLQESKDEINVCDDNISLDKQKIIPLVHGEEHECKLEIQQSIDNLNLGKEIQTSIQSIESVEDISSNNSNEKLVHEIKETEQEIPSNTEDRIQDDLTGHFDGTFDDWDIGDIVSPSVACKLDLSSWQRCKILSVNEDIDRKSKILELQSTQSGDICQCALRGVWKFGNIKSGLIVSVIASFQSCESIWVIDNDNGFLVEFPDVLISPTTIVGSISCMRQGVLNYLISKTDVDENSKIMILGSLIHELLQQVLSQGNNSPEFIASIIEEIISSPYNIKLLYSSKMPLCEARGELLNAVPNVQKFCATYSLFCDEKAKASIPNTDEAWKGKIKSVVAVEDNYWIPHLGLKGKVDVSVYGVEHSQSKEQFMPVEVKTGSAKNSVEHRGQVILYCLMASQIISEVDRGLLVYLREGFARKVLVGRREQRDIVLLRNQLVNYIIPQSSPHKKSPLADITLPPPVGNTQVCKWCPHLTICAAFLRASGEEEVYMKTKAQDLRTSSLVHLSTKHIDYVIHWCKLLWTEERDKPENSLKDLWTVSPADREKNGVCLSNLKLCTPVKCKELNSYIHVLARKEEDKKFDFSSHSFSEGQMVLVSTHQRVAIAFGIILEVKCNSLTIDVPRDLSQICLLFGDTFIIDLYEPKTNSNWCFGNLAALLENREESSHLRRLIIDQEKPVFDNEKLSSESKCDFSFNLNKSQESAIKRALATQDYLLIRGFPGSGKSFTVAVLVQQLVSKGLSVLLTAHTNSAVDTVLLKLLNLKVDFLRIGASCRIHEAIQPWSEDNLTKSCHTPEQLEKVYNSKLVVAATCWGVKHALFSQRTFDVCIVDESTQVLQPVILGPLFRAKRFILVGDPEQLPPVVKSLTARQQGLSECLFTRLDSPETSIELDIQYRMNSKIMELANNLTYAGKLQCGSESVANATLSIETERINFSHPAWVIRSLSCEVDASVVFINVSKVETNKSQLINLEEALVVKTLIEAFTNNGIQLDDIGIMAPYRDQVKFLQSKILISQKIEINTVDQYQGRDKDVVIFSCTNNWSTNESSSSDVGILNDKRRMTVAITRAKKKFIMIGNERSLKKFPPFKQIMDFMHPSNKFEVKCEL